MLDVAKGVAAVLLARLLFAGDPLVEWAAALAGVAAIVGHNWSVVHRLHRRARRRDLGRSAGGDVRLDAPDPGADRGRS